uniref:Uncharacterized protein n=1 Tax=viral metagenome TaxID=1070528 RepID=A0A6M3JUR7_9ZZZZ
MFKLTYRKTKWIYALSSISLFIGILMSNSIYLMLALFMIITISGGYLIWFNDENVNRKHKKR